MDLDIGSLPITKATVVTIALILIDTVLGVLRAVKLEEFDFRKLPKFLATSIVPYIGGLIVLGLAAQFIGAPFVQVFYGAVAAVSAKFLLEMKDKVKQLFGGV